MACNEGCYDSAGSNIPDSKIIYTGEASDELSICPGDNYQEVTEILIAQIVALTARVAALEG